MRIFVVRKGDSLYSIGKRFGVPVQTLAHINGLTDPSRLTVGQSLVIPDGTAGELGEIEVNGYAYPNISTGLLNAAMPYLTFLCPFSWQMDSAGGITPIEDRAMIQAAYAGGTAPMLTVTNIASNGGFSSDIAHAVFTDMAVQDTLIENILSVLRSRSYYGVNLNIEYVYPFDREGYNNFLRRLSERLHPLGYYLSTAIAPKTSDAQQGLLYTAHDYAAHGMYCDRVIIMTYEWGFTYSSPQAVSPVDRIREVLDYAVTQIPSGKILLGFSNYGYNWTLPWKQGQAAAVISNTAAVNLAAAKFAEIKFNERAQAPYFNYTDPNGVRHEVWFEDARSAEARLSLVREYKLAGASWWTINFANPAGWAVLNSLYSVEKIV